MFYSFVKPDFYYKLKDKVLNFKNNYISLLGKDVKYAPLNSIDIELIQNIFKKRIKEFGKFKLNDIYIINGLSYSRTKENVLLYVETFISFNKNSFIVEE